MADGGEYSPEALEDLEAMVRGGLDRWGFRPDADVTLLNVSENATYRLDDRSEGRRLVLRVHRIGYRGEPEIRSELAWIEALRAERVVETPAPIAARDGRFVQTLMSPGGRPDRFAVAFEFAGGREPDQSADLVGWFRRLGAITARMHEHSRRWRRPDGFVRDVWDFDTMLGDRPHWGPWRAGLGLDHAGRAHLSRAVALIGRRLERFGKGPQRYGLIHADPRLANLLVDGETLSVIDFDDCGFSWFVYDFASAVSFFEHDPIVPALMDAWVEGYRTVAALSQEEAEELPVFVMLRRILLVAWIASHAETPTAQEMGTAYTDGALTMAEDLLARYG
jgi:Ser/Thr protein kinase RdoA (MazF antagonist)